MRLLVARCEVRYSGRLNAVLPEAVRLLILKAEGSVLVHDDGGGYKPLNWMTAPTFVEDEGDRLVVRKPKTEDLLEIRLVQGLSAVHDAVGGCCPPARGRAGRAPEGRRGARPAGGAPRGARRTRRGADAGAARVADG